LLADRVLCSGAFCSELAVPDFLTDLAGLRVGADRLLAAVLEAAAQPMVIVDPDGVIRFANPPAAFALGYDNAGALLGRPMDGFSGRDGARVPVSHVSVPFAMAEGHGAVVTFTATRAREESLRRIAALVAGGAASADVFAAIAREVGHVIGVPLVVVSRSEAEQTAATVIGAWSDAPHPFRTGTRWSLDGQTILGQVLKTGRPARVDDSTERPGTIAAAGDNSGFRAAAGAPIIVAGEVWGAMTAAARSAALPDHIEDRLAEFADLVATAIANTESRAGLARLAEEQAALRRVATLAARGTSPEELFAAVVEEVGRVFPVENVGLARYESDGTMTTVAVSERLADSFPVGSRWPLGGQDVSTVVFETDRPARIDKLVDTSSELGVAVRGQGFASSVGAPIVVEGRVWGLMAIASTEQPLLADTEAHLASFTELLATTIANAESRAGVTRLAADQAALRRVATLVARAAPPEDVFAAVAEEIGRLLPVDFADLGRCEPDGTITFVASWGKTRAVFPVGARVKLGGKNATTLVAQTGRPVRVDSYEDASGAIGSPTRETGVRSAVGTPVTVDGHLWGVMAAGWSLEEPMPADTESRLAQFTDLLETAIANADSRARLARLAEEQAALRRVATLVARATPPEEVFAAVANEVGLLFSADLANVCRYESDGMITFVASAGDLFPVGSRWPIKDKNLATLVLETGRPARLDDYADASGPLADGVRDEGIRSAVGTPIIVEGRLWGLMAAGSRQEQPLPSDTEARLASFTELVATAIANTEARSEVGRLVDEQAALRRVATLVARGAAPEAVFAAVTEEVARLFLANLATMCRYESDGTYTIVARAGTPFPVGSRWPLGGKNLATVVFETGRPTRIENYAEASGPLAEDVRAVGGRSAVGAPITVEDHLWGATAVVTSGEQPLPADTEERLAAFMELVATAIANAEARTEVAASRARIVAATDEERRRVVRDLHDGAQQRLVHTVITLKLAHRALENEEHGLPALLTEALDNAEQATDELRELAHGILPPVLTQGGLRAGVDALAERMAVPVQNSVSVGRLPGAVEATAYFVIAEALTNVAKHARARRADVAARVEDGTLRVRVRDDGVGGAVRHGSGLLGLADRLAVLDGRLRVESPLDGGTLVAADIPVPQ
jgi:GAF domain-containing protein